MNPVTVVPPISVIPGAPLTAPLAAPLALDATTFGNLMLVAPAPSATTLLKYSALVKPDPLQVGTPGMITIVISNPLHDTVTVAEILVSLQPGVAGKDLASSLTALAVSASAGWSAANNNGTVSLTPQTPAAAQVGKNGLWVTISGFTVNDQVGTTTLTIDESASTPKQPKQNRSSSIDLPKFPAQFYVGDLVANPDHLPSGDTATLNWTSSASPGAAYQINYIRDDDGNSVSDTVGATGPYQTMPLTRTGIIIFNLVVTVTVPGQDHPLVVRRQTYVTIEKLTAQLSASSAIVGVNGLVRLAWSSARAVKCTLVPQVGASVNVATQGEAYITVGTTRTFTLTAYDASGKFVQSPVTIAVDPSMKPNQPGYVIQGASGQAGPRGADNFPQAQDGGRGGTGGSITSGLYFGALDPSPTPVLIVPVTVVGGTGGSGGDGGNSEFNLGIFRLSGIPGNGGRGGDGGNAHIAVTVNPDAAPALYLLSVSPGAAGGGGNPGIGNRPGSPGSAGNAGVASATINGLPLIVFP